MQGLYAFSGLADGHWMFGYNRRYCVLIDHLLFAVAGQHHGEGVESSHIAPHLVAIHEKNGDGAAVTAHLGEENFLKIVDFLHK